MQPRPMSLARLDAHRSPRISPERSCRESAGSAASATSADLRLTYAARSVGRGRSWVRSQVPWAGQGLRAPIRPNTPHRCCSLSPAEGF
eukprot:scaffold25021_cov25-Tisochrysis_lutea.AAC.2